MAQFTVIGLGAFGATIALQLTELNHEVIGIDCEKKYVENIAHDITHAVIADASDEHVLQELNIQNSDAVVVAIGENIEASILCVLHLKNMGINKIWVKAKSKAHHMILTRLGVDKIIHPEEDMGIRIAQSLSYPMVSRYMALENDHFLVKVEIKVHLSGKPLHYFLEYMADIKILLHKRGATINYQPESDLQLMQHDILVLEGQLEALRRLSQRFNE